MTATHQPKQADFSRNTSALPTGGDVGAGLTKLVIDSGDRQMKLRHPSKVVEVTEELHDVLTAKDGGHFYYHEGVRSDLIGREFLTGALAAWKAPSTHIKLSDDPSLKADYALHCILGAVASLPYRPQWSLHLALSIHNAKVFAPALKEKVQGCHSIRNGGKAGVTSRVNLTVSLVAPEGAGSYGYCLKSQLIDQTAHAIAFDFGTSTVIPTVFAPGGAIIHRQVLEVGGCIDLLSAIASDTELIEFLGKGKSGSVELIRQGIESGKFKYGSRAFKFEGIYSRQIETWLNDRLRLALKEVEEWRDAAQSLVAWGGGTQMPGIAEMLKTQDIIAVSDGCWANALGLQRMAEGRLARGK